MKKASLFIFFISIIFTSCSKEEAKENQITNNNLVGNWKVTNVTSENGKISGSVAGVPLNIGFSATGKDYSMVITFSDNPKKITNTGSFTLVSTITILTKTEKIEQKISNIPAINGNWNIENNILTTIQNGKKANINIVSYNNSEIVFKYSMSESMEDIAGMNLTNGKIDGSLILKAVKQ